MVRRAKTYDWKDLDALRESWRRIFGEEMGYGFEIGPDQVPMMKECLRLKSQKPLHDYIKEISKNGRIY